MAHDVVRPAAAIAPQPRWAHPHADHSYAADLYATTSLRAQRTYYAGRQERGERVLTSHGSITSPPNRSHSRPDVRSSTTKADRYSINIFVVSIASFSYMRLEYKPLPGTRPSTRRSTNDRSYTITCVPPVGPLAVYC